MPSIASVPSAIVQLIRRTWPIAMAFGVSASVALALWRTTRQVPVVSDEAAYLLQAEIFASGSWAGPARPLPRFFDQIHVFSAPRLIPKYPPGHALLMVPGVWLGHPGALSLLLTGATGAFIFLLSRRVGGSAIGTLAVGLWLIAPTNIRFRPSYFSEVTTTFLWIGAWWALLRWHETRNPRWLVVISICATWCAITRPLTAVALAVPIGVFVVSRTLRSGNMRHLLGPITVGLLIIAIIPLWNWRTMGDWRTTPYVAYSKQFFPYDRPGFELTQLGDTLAQQSDIREIDRQFARLHREYQFRSVPGAAVARSIAVLKGA